MSKQTLPSWSYSVVLPVTLSLIHQFACNMRQELVKHFGLLIILFPVLPSRAGKKISEKSRQSWTKWKRTSIQKYLPRSTQLEIFFFFHDLWRVKCLPSLSTMSSPFPPLDQSKWRLWFFVQEAFSGGWGGEFRQGWKREGERRTVRDQNGLLSSGPAPLECSPTRHLQHVYGHLKTSF